MAVLDISFVSVNLGCKNLLGVRASEISFLSVLYDSFKQ